MVDLHSSSDSEAYDSDEELQKAFAEGRLKSTGLNVEVAPPKQLINNVSGMKQKLDELQQTLDWTERLDLTNDPAPPPGGGTELTEEGDELANNDFKRELRFYRQAQASVLIGIPRLHKKGLKTRRPEDYFAEMSKSDVHMKKVREKLLEKQQNIENRDKARKLRELRKYGKKVQQDVLLKRQKEKREMLDAVKKFRKGQKNKLDFLDDKDKGNKNKGQKREVQDKNHQPNKKRQYKNQKYGFGGQKKRSKLNTKESSGDMSSFNVKVNQGRPGFNKSNKGNKNKGNKRPGKSQRTKMKSKRH
ncbi:probable rRNA-processing protein EBP2 [Ruditapes philippinarum]|uniref:probable rRNA-processing protein EBP2 n=1 Tax=Ruditapes philippinarum TaxID=129788 RepID=UPI00295AB530|nr:probable rRNA-processing protein EBP2 [Ruditapes philippinarum]